MARFALIALLVAACAAQTERDASPPAEPSPAAPSTDAQPADGPAETSGGMESMESMSMSMGSMGMAPETASDRGPGMAPRAAGVPGPALTRLPPPPSIVRPGRPVLPEPRELERDAWVADRFTAEGQRVLYPFTAEEGELSLFDFAAWGYARAWDATGALAIQDGTGRTLLEHTTAGGSSWRDFVPFRAPAAGRYVLSLAARSSFYRYVIVRHSGYAPREPGERLGPLDDGLHHGYLLGGGDRARYAVELAAGEEVELKVLDTDEEVRAHWRGVKAHGGAAAPGRRGEAPYPELDLRVSFEGRALGPAAHYRLLRAERGGTYVVEVAARGERGALFDLSVQRAPRREEVHGLILDRFDQPVAGVTLAFRRLPDLDFAGRTRTDEGGRYAARLPPGAYRIELSRAGEERTRTFETEVREPRELNTIW